MPPRPPTAGRNSRRRPGPVMPGGWVWLVLLGIVVVLLVMFGTNGSNRVESGEFYKLLTENKLKKVTLIGTDRILAEVKSDAVEGLSPEVKSKLSKKSEFLVDRAKGDEKLLFDALNQAKVRWEQKDEPMGWVGQAF